MRTFFKDPANRIIFPISGILIFSILLLLTDDVSKIHEYATLMLVGSSIGAIRYFVRIGSKAKNTAS